MSCAQCRSPLPADAKPNHRYCGAACRNRANNARAKSRQVRPDEHGKRTGYARGCRCDECRAYNASYSRLVRDRQPKRPRAPRSDKGVQKSFIAPEDHGTVRGYGMFRCRCDACRRAASDYNRVWREANRQKYRAAMTRFRRMNPDKVRSYSAARAAAPFDEAALAYCALIERDPCVYCGAPAESVDHIQPVALGGDSRWDNLAPACRLCNSSKSRKTLLAFLMYRS